MKRRTRASLLLRFAGRMAATSVALLILALVGVQFARIAAQNIALAHELSSTQNDVTMLQAKHLWQVRQLKRLEDPRGAIPEIHDRLRLVAHDEAIIFVSPAPSIAPSPAP